MTIASFLHRHRRVLILCAATVALHYLAIDWVGTRLGVTRPHKPKAEPSLITAQLRLALPTPTPGPAEPLPEVQPLARHALRPVPRPIVAPEPEPVPAAVTAPDPALTELPQLEAPPSDNASAPDAAASAAQAQAGAAQVAPALSSAQPVAGTDQSAAPPPEPMPSQGMKRYKVNLPPSADFDLDVRRVDANGTVWNGAAGMSWHTDGSTYKLSVEAGISMLITRINLLVLTSEGTIDDFGIAPTTATEKRAGRSMTATHFNRDEGTISFSATDRSYPLLVGAQDKATVPFQLGGIGRADTNQFSSPVDILVGEDKEANVFRFQLLGQEELNTRMGRIVTWHLMRPPKPGTYSSRLDIWLAPSRSWYPIQIQNTEASGALTTQTVSKITVLEPGK